MWPLAICNEMWKDKPIEQVFAKARDMGYEGVEIGRASCRERVS